MNSVQEVLVSTLSLRWLWILLLFTFLRLRPEKQSSSFLVPEYIIIAHANNINILFVVILIGIDIGQSGTHVIIIVVGAKWDCGKWQLIRVGDDGSSDRTPLHPDHWQCGP